MAAFLVVAIFCGMAGAALVVGLGGSLLVASLAYVLCGALALVLPAIIISLRAGNPTSD